MIELFLKIIVYTLIYAMVIESFGIFQRSTKIFEKYIPGSEIYRAINKSKKTSSDDKLLIGDSVAEQLFSNKSQNHNPNSLTTNQAISIAGNYFLLNNYLNNGNKIKELFLLYTPFSFTNNLNQIYSFHYFAKPFGQGEYDSLYTPLLKTKFKEIPFSYIVKSSYIYTSRWAPKYESKADSSYKFMSPMSKEYLIKIKELAKTYNFKFTIISTPVRLSRKHEVLSLNILEETKESEIEKEIKDYFNSIYYINDKNFLDENHLKDFAIEKQKSLIQKSYFTN